MNVAGTGWGAVGYILGPSSLKQKIINELILKKSSFERLTLKIF